MSDTSQAGVVVAAGEQFELLEIDGGSARLLRSKEDSSTAKIEGEELSGFLAAYEEIKSQFPEYSADQILAQLWDQGGYSWMAEADDA